MVTDADTARVRLETLREIKRLALDCMPGDVPTSLAHIVRLCIDAGVTDKTPVHTNPLFYVSDNRVMQRSTKTTMGFLVCTVHDGVDPAEVCAILNRGEQEVT